MEEMGEHIDKGDGGIIFPQQLGYEIKRPGCVISVINMN